MAAYSFARVYIVVDWTPTESHFCSKWWPTCEFRCAHAWWESIEAKWKWHCAFWLRLFTIFRELNASPLHRLMRTNYSLSKIASIFVGFSNTKLNTIPTFYTIFFSLRPHTLTYSIYLVYSIHNRPIPVRYASLTDIYFVRGLLLAASVCTNIGVAFASAAIALYVNARLCASALANTGTHSIWIEYFWCAEHIKR